MAGYWCRRGSIDRFGGDTLDGSHKLCIAGHYCPSGSSNGTGASLTDWSHKVCKAGYYCPSGSLSEFGAGACAPRETGNWCPVGSTSMEGELCSAGHYCPAISGLVDTQLECALGQYCPEGSRNASLCAAGSHCPDPSQQVACNAGQYCPEGSRNASLCAAGSYCPDPSQQVPCKPNSRCPEGSVAEGIPAQISNDEISKVDSTHTRVTLLDEKTSAEAADVTSAVVTAAIGTVVVSSVTAATASSVGAAAGGAAAGSVGGVGAGGSGGSASGSGGGNPLTMIGHVQFFSMTGGSAMPGLPKLYTMSGEGLGWTTLKLDPLGFKGMKGADSSAQSNSSRNEVGAGGSGGACIDSLCNNGSAATVASRMRRALLTDEDEESGDAGIGSAALYFLERYELSPYYGQLISSVIFMLCVSVLRLALLGCVVMSRYASEDDEALEENLDALGGGLDGAAQMLLVSNDIVDLAASDLVAETEVGEAVADVVDDMGVDVDIKCCGMCAGIPVVGDCIIGLNQYVCSPLFSAVPQLEMLVEVFAEGSLIERLQFPALECFAAIFALPGMAEACAALLSSGDDVALAVGGVVLFSLVLFVGISCWLIIFQVSERLLFDGETEEYLPKEEDDLFVKLYHGYSFADFRPGAGQVYLFVNILVAFARSIAFGAYAFACPQGSQVLCGLVQTFVVLILLAFLTLLLMTNQPYLSGDDQVVEEVSAWCNLLTILGILAMPFCVGTQYASPLGWALIILQLISILNQIWYNMKPLLLAAVDYVCPAKEDEEGDGSDKGNAGRWAVVRNRISDIQADPGNKSTSFISNKVHPVEE